jgi:hypothetical protein
MPLFILAGGELVLLFLGARIGWWILRTRERGAAARRGEGPTGGGIARLAARAPGGVRAGAANGAGTLREAA